MRMDQWLDAAAAARPDERGDQDEKRKKTALLTIPFRTFFVPILSLNLPS
jgi:hypothetical protein